MHARAKATIDQLEAVLPSLLQEWGAELIRHAEARCVYVVTPWLGVEVVELELLAPGPPDAPLGQRFIAEVEGFWRDGSYPVVLWGTDGIQVEPQSGENGEHERLVPRQISSQLRRRICVRI